jgi:ATP-dependent exoDNAse (exonuclease V) beta subunit
VRVLTVHKAKGLEAPCTVVFSWSAILAGADVDELKFQPFLTGSFLRDGEIQTFRGIATRFGPLTIETRGLAKAQRVLVEHERAEAMRLAYVAATRAKDRLILVAPLTEQPAHGGLLDELTAEPAAHDAPHSLFGGALSVRLGSSDAARELLELERTRAVVLGEDHASYWQSRLAEADEAADKPVVWSATMAHREEDPAQQDADTAVGAAPEWDDEVNEAGRTLREEAMARGVLVHAYLEHFVTESTFVAEQLSTLAAAEELPISGLAFDEASAILTAFFGRETRDDNGTAHLDRIHRARILGREVPFYLKNNNGQSWTGVMDLVIEEGDRIVSVDYKATPRREVKQSYHTQRELYTEALQRLFPDKEIGFEFFWLWTEAAASI